jgi:hypothetical protein
MSCGGSASETPEPERPDAWQLKLRHDRKMKESSENAGPSEDTTPLRELDDAPPAKSTWGSNRRRTRVNELEQLPTKTSAPE